MDKIIFEEENIVRFINSSDELTIKRVLVAIEDSMEKLDTYRVNHPYMSRDYSCYISKWIDLHRRDINYNLQTNFPLIFNFDENASKVVTPKNWRSLEWLRYDDLTDDEQGDGMTFHMMGLDVLDE